MFCCLESTGFQITTVNSSPEVPVGYSTSVCHGDWILRWQTHPASHVLWLVCCHSKLNSLQATASLKPIAYENVSMLWLNLCDFVLNCNACFRKTKSRMLKANTQRVDNCSERTITQPRLSRMNSLCPMLYYYNKISNPLHIRNYLWTRRNHRAPICPVRHWDS